MPIFPHYYQFFQNLPPNLQNTILATCTVKGIKYISWNGPNQWAGLYAITISMTLVLNFRF